MEKFIIKVCCEGDSSLEFYSFVVNSNLNGVSIGRIIENEIVELLENTEIESSLA